MSQRSVRTQKLKQICYPWDKELNEAWLENTVFVLKNLTWKYCVDETSQTSTWFSKTNILKQQ